LLLLGSGNWRGFGGLRSGSRGQFLADGLATLTQGKLMFSDAMETGFIAVDT